MTALQTLLAQREEIERQIAAQKPAAIAQVFALMQQLGVSAEDMGFVEARKPATRPVKYRDATGNTWTGVGQRPRWLQAQLRAGASLEQFQVR